MARKYTDKQIQEIRAIAHKMGFTQDTIAVIAGSSRTFVGLVVKNKRRKEAGGHITLEDLRLKNQFAREREGLKATPEVKADLLKDYLTSSLSLDELEKKYHVSKAYMRSMLNTVSPGLSSHAIRLALNPTYKAQVQKQKRRVVNYELAKQIRELVRSTTKLWSKERGALQQEIADRLKVSRRLIVYIVRGKGIWSQEKYEGIPDHANAQREAYLEKRAARKKNEEERERKFRKAESRALFPRDGKKGRLSDLQPPEGLHADDEVS